MARRRALAVMGATASLLVGGVTYSAPAQAESMPHIACQTWKSGGGKAHGSCRGTARNYYQTVATCLRGDGTGTFTRKGPWETIGIPNSVASCGSRVVAIRVAIKQQYGRNTSCAIYKDSAKKIHANCTSVNQNRKYRARGTCKAGSRKWALRGAWKRTGSSVAKCSGSGKLTGRLEVELSKRQS
ncbi:hypothetical protein GCM10010252_02390 [Streptomyces aureoverticillatus]|nr:hypothetical protein GCM10010252_02390 [Streptomyces aureoverticillatus]